MDGHDAIRYIHTIRQAKREPMKEPDPKPILLEGKTVKRAYQEAGEPHSLDNCWENDGDVVIEFTDGSTITVSSHWCNDSTSSTEVHVTAFPS